MTETPTLLPAHDTALANCQAAFARGTVVRIRQRPEVISVRRVNEVAGEMLVTKRSGRPRLAAQGQWIVTRLTAGYQPKLLDSGITDRWIVDEVELLRTFKVMAHELRTGEGFGSARYLGVMMYAMPLVSVLHPDGKMDVMHARLDADGFTVETADATQYLIALDFNAQEGRAGRRFALMHGLSVAETCFAAEGEASGLAESVLAQLRLKYCLS